MTTQSIGSESLNIIATNNSQGSNNKVKDSSGFKDVMDKNMNSNNTEAKGTSNNKVKEDNKVISNYSNPKPVKEDGNTFTNVSSSTIDADNVNEVISEVNLEIQKMLSENLNLSEEDLLSIMETLGLQFVDLLNPNNLQLFIMNVNGLNDVSELITSDMAFQQIEDITNLFNEYIENEFPQLSKDDLISLFEENLNSQLPDDTIEDNSINQEPDEDKQQMKEDFSTVVKPEETIESIPLESTSSDSKSGFSEKDAKDSKADITFEQVVQNIVSESSSVKVEMVDVGQVTQMREIVNQIVEQIKIIIKPDMTSMELMLNPENLGKVNLNVTAKDGIMTAQFVVENQVAKEAIESQIQVLRESLENQGIKVDAVEVTVSNFAFNKDEGQNFSNNEHKKSNKKSLTIDEVNNNLNATEEDDMETKEGINLGTGNLVDYTA